MIFGIWDGKWSTANETKYLLRSLECTQDSKVETMSSLKDKNAFENWWDFKSHSPCLQPTLFQRSSERKSPNLISLCFHSVRGALFSPAFFNGMNRSLIGCASIEIRYIVGLQAAHIFTHNLNKIVYVLMSKVYGLCVRMSNIFLCKAFDFNGFFYWHNHMHTHTHISAWKTKHRFIRCIHTTW